MYSILSPLESSNGTCCSSSSTLVSGREFIACSGGTYSYLELTYRCSVAGSALVSFMSFGDV